MRTQQVSGRLPQRNQILWRQWLSYLPNQVQFAPLEAVGDCVRLHWLWQYGLLKRSRWIWWSGLGNNIWQDIRFDLISFFAECCQGVNDNRDKNHLLAPARLRKHMHIQMFRDLYVSKCFLWIHSYLEVAYENLPTKIQFHSNKLDVCICGAHRKVRWAFVKNHGRRGLDSTYESDC